MKIGLFLSVLALTLHPLRAAEGKLETVVLGAGCFWCVEAFFEQQPGVTDVVSGYAGGEQKDPSYEQVCTGRTGHAEVVQVTFDPERTSLEKIVDFFWKTHDVTNGSGVAPDFGSQYRSIILYSDDAQKTVIEKSKAEAQQHLKKPIATEISQLKKFYPAEGYHQDYVRNHLDEGYVRQVAIPKIKKLGLKVPGA